MGRKKRNKHEYSTMAIILLFGTLILTYAIASLDSNDIDDFNLCSRENVTLARNSTSWYCAETVIGELYYHNHDTPLTVTYPTANTSINVTELTTGDCINALCNNYTITVNRTGLYKIGGTVSFTGGKNKDYEFEIAVNDDETNDCEFYRTMGTSVVKGVGAFTCVLRLNEDDVVHMKSRCVTSPIGNSFIYHVNWNIVQIK